MKLTVKCPNCDEVFPLKKTYSTRPDLIYEMGEYFHLSCSHCLSNREYHANDVKAEEVLSVNIIGSAIGISIIILVTLFAFDQGVITNAGLILGGGIVAASNYSVFTSNVTAFNKYKVQRTKRKGR